MRTESKYTRAVRLAYDQGYRVIDGKILNPQGKEITGYLLNPSSKNHSGHYRYFSVKTGDGVLKVPAHRLVAFQLFGDLAFIPRTHTRHLNGDPQDNREENITIGSAHDNHMDRPAEHRKNHALRATGFTRKYSPEFVDGLRAMHASGISYKRLRAAYRIPLSMLSYYLAPGKRQAAATARNRRSAQ